MCQIVKYTNGNNVSRLAIEKNDRDVKLLVRIDDI